MALATPSVAGCMFFRSLGELTSEAQTDASATDALSPDAHAGADGVAPDAAGDADLADAGYRPFCTALLATTSTPPRLCDDFEDGPLGAKWTRIEQGNGGSIVLDRTPPGTGRLSAALVKLPSPCTEAYAQLKDEASGKVASARIRFKVRVTAGPGPGAGMQIAGVTYSTAAGFYRVDLALIDDHFALFENDNGAFASYLTSAKFQVGAYSEVDLALTFAGAPGAAVTIDGAAALSRSVLARAQTSATFEMDFGGYVSNGCATPSELSVDDVVYEFTLQ